MQYLESKSAQDELACVLTELKYKTLQVSDLNKFELHKRNSTTQTRNPNTGAESSFNLWRLLLKTKKKGHSIKKNKRRRRRRRPSSWLARKSSSRLEIWMRLASETLIFGGGGRPFLPIASTLQSPAALQPRSPSALLALYIYIYVYAAAERAKGARFQGSDTYRLFLAAAVPVSMVDNSGSS